MRLSTEGARGAIRRVHKRDSASRPMPVQRKWQGGNTRARREESEGVMRNVLFWSAVVAAFLVMCWLFYRAGYEYERRKEEKKAKG